MAVLTHDFLQIRKATVRYKRFVLLAVIILIVAGASALGFYLYSSSSQKPGKSSAVAEVKARTLPRDWLLKYFATDDENSLAVGGPEGDPDGDILTNEQEFFYGTDPTNPDTLGDGQLDGVKVAANINPLTGGPLNTLDYAKLAADRVIEAYNVPEFKRENIEKQVLGLLNPPDPAKLDVGLPDPKTLKVSNDNSMAAIDDYFQKFDKYTQDFDTSDQGVQNILENPGLSDSAMTLANIYEAINSLRNLSVPSDFLKVHQLHIAALFAAANILEINKTIDLTVDMELQKDKVQEQYRNVAIIQKINQELLAATDELMAKYQALSENPETKK
jgi:hypothetical protein